MAKNEKTGPAITKTASSVLRDPSASKSAKSMAGSALSQAHTGKQTSPAAATTAAKVLNDARTSQTTKSLAGSVLTQKPKK